MNNYVNAFRLASKDDGDELILHLIQENPQFAPDGNFTNMEHELVAGIVTTKSNAAKLAKTILEHLEASTKNSSI